MAKARNKVNYGNWVKLDMKHQSNVKELLALIKTIDDVQMKEVAGMTLVQFPDRKSPMTIENKGKKNGQHIKKIETTAALNSKTEKEEEHHYSAIMLK